MYFCPVLSQIPTGAEGKWRQNFRNFTSCTKLGFIVKSCAVNKSLMKLQLLECKSCKHRNDPRYCAFECSATLLYFNSSQDAASCQQSRRAPRRSWYRGRNTQGQQTICWTFGWKTTHRLHQWWWPWRRPRLRGTSKVSDPELNTVSPSKCFSSTLWCARTQKWPPQVRMEKKTSEQGFSKRLNLVDSLFSSFWIAAAPTVTSASCWDEAS